MDDFPVPTAEDFDQDKYEEYVDSWFNHSDGAELNTKETWQVSADDLVISDELPF